MSLLIAVFLLLAGGLSSAIEEEGAAPKPLEKWAKGEVKKSE
jgi:hypothetical protein